MSLSQQIQKLFALQNPQLEYLDIPVHDVVAITTAAGKYALKIYSSQARTNRDVQWELDLILHLKERGAPIVSPVKSRHGYVETLIVDGQERPAVLFEWASGEKPRPSHQIYLSLGTAAAHIHAAADSFRPSWMREIYDSEVLIDEQIERMKTQLMAADRYDTMTALGERLKKLIANPALDLGVCHMDLTLDNVHLHNQSIMVFDFDSSGWCWRASEAWGVLRLSEDYFKDWLKGYRTVRPFSEADEHAVAAFGIIGDIRNVVWKLGEARSSRGKPLITASDLPKIIDDWLHWERTRL